MNKLLPPLPRILQIEGMLACKYAVTVQCDGRTFRDHEAEKPRCGVLAGTGCGTFKLV